MMLQERRSTHSLAMATQSPRQRDLIICILCITYLFLLVHLLHWSIILNSFLAGLRPTVRKLAAISLHNIATGKTATQSSTLGNFSASRAIDGDISTYSHTNDDNAWLEIDMGDVYPINHVEISNRWCLDPNDLPGCLCRLSGIELSLIDDNNFVVATESIGNSCGLKEVTVNFDAKCATATQSHLMTPGCLPLAKSLKLQSTTNQAIHVFEVQVFSPLTSGDQQSKNELAKLGRSKTIHRTQDTNAAESITSKEYSADKLPNRNKSTDAKVSVETIKRIYEHNSSLDSKPSSQLRDSKRVGPRTNTRYSANQPNNEKLGPKTDVRKSKNQALDQLEKPRSGFSIDRVQSNGIIPPYGDQSLAVSPTATHWEPVALTEDMLNSGLRFFVFLFNPLSGLGSTLMNLFGQIVYHSETSNRHPIANLTNYGYRRNSTAELLTGFFSPRFPVVDQEEQVALVQKYSGEEENSTVWITQAYLYRRKIQRKYSKSVVFYKKMVQHTCPHLMFNDDTKREMHKVRQDHGIDFDFGAPSITSVAFHVRRTDKEVETVPATAAEYVERLLKIFIDMDQIPNIHHCYIATDDVMAIAEVESELVRAGISCTVNSLQTNVLDTESRTNFENSLILLTELSIMQEATYFVGTFTSNISDLVAVLRGCTHSDQTNFSHSYDVFGSEFRLY